MSMTYAELTQAMEDAGFAACRNAFIESHPDRFAANSETCEDGEWECTNCPWRKKEADHERA